MTLQGIIKIERLLFYFFIFCIPFQTRLILAKWPVLRSFSEGGSPLPDISFNEWASAFLYLSDLLILILLGLWLIRIVTKQSRLDYQKRDFFLLCFFAVSAFSITQSHFSQISWYQLLKLAEFIALYFYIRSNRDQVFNLDNILRVVVLSGIFQAVIAISQYIKQASLGLHWLGESPLHLPGQGIASFYSEFQLILRPYGTMPHPNILATFLFVSLVSFVVLYLSKKSTALFSNDRAKIALWRKKELLLIGYGAMLYAFFLTYSRTVIAIPVATLVLLSIVTWFNKNWRKQVLQYKRQLMTLWGVSVIVVALFLALNYQEVVARVFFSKDDEAVTMRLFYNRVAGQDFLNRTWLGSGIGTFVSNLMVTLKHVPSNIFQPVHNIYLLILAETGLLGLAFWGLFIKSTIRNYFSKRMEVELPYMRVQDIILPAILVCFLLIGLFDHFFWTLQQGHLLLWLVLALLV